VGDMMGGGFCDCGKENEEYFKISNLKLLPNSALIKFLSALYTEIPNPFIIS
jgi:hypothetical protein